ncbi:MAG: EamA family transporter [Actinobacteria bacterium]|nr:EamA family transporter [Actinomycetota bacterium]
MRSSSQFFRTASPEALFVISGICQYTGAVIAVNLFDELNPATVAVFRVLLGAFPILLISMRDQRAWTRDDLKAAAVFGLATAAMNLCFYLGIDRLPLGKSVVMEFIGPIAVAAYFTRTRRNTVALVLAASGVAILSGVELGGDPLGVLFILMASAFWAAYIVLGRRVAGLDRGLSGLGVGLLIGGLAIMPFGFGELGTVITTPRLLWLCFLVGLLSSSIGYAIDQVVLRRIPMRRFALLLALLPVTAMVVGLIALDQTPSIADLAGAALVISGVVLQERDELPSPMPEEIPG